MFFDQICGLQKENLGTTVSDYVLQRRDGVFSYQFVFAVDDLHMGITEVVRGQDILPSTARQLLIIDLLGGKRPSYAHIPLCLNANGEKLSKRDASLSLASLRESGGQADMWWGILHGDSGYCRMYPITPKELVQYFDWSCTRDRPPCILPENLPDVLASSVTIRR